MRAEPPKFPRNRAVGGKSKWFAADVADWLDELPVRKLKGDTSPDQQTKQKEEFAPA